MEAQLLSAALATLAGFAAPFAIIMIAGISVRQRASALAAQGEAVTVGAMASWRVRNGFPALIPAARALLKTQRIASIADELVIACSERGLATTPEAALSVLLAALLGCACAAAIITGSALGALASAACLLAVITAVGGNAKDKRLEAVREAVPEALESMAACFGSGFTLLQTFRQVAADTPGPLGAVFARCAHVLEVGGSAERALGELRAGAGIAELAFVAVALDVQHQSGGAMKQVLDAANDSVKGELALRRSLRVQTAQAKLSARIVSVMPIILITAFTYASPDFLAPFFASPFGYALLALAVVMQVAGILLVRRALSVDGVS